VEKTAALGARPPGLGREAEARGLEGAVVDDARDPAKGRDPLVGQAGRLPGLFQRAGVELDVERLVVEAPDLGREQATPVRDEVEEGGAQPLEVGRTVGGEALADLAAAPLDRALHDLFGGLGAEALGERLVEGGVDQGAAHVRFLELPPELLLARHALVPLARPAHQSCRSHAAMSCR
jgi:hypothetical protein